MNTTALHDVFARATWAPEMQGILDEKYRQLRHEIEVLERRLRAPECPTYIRITEKDDWAQSRWPRYEVCLVFDKDFLAGSFERGWDVTKIVADAFLVNIQRRWKGGV